MEEPKLITTRLVFDDWPPAGVRVAPGAYIVRLRVGETTVEAKARVLPNPRVAAAAADLERQSQLLAEIHGRLAETHDLVRRIRDLETQVRDQVERAAQLGKAGGLQQAARELTAKLDGVAEKLWNPELQADEDSLVYTPKLDFQFAALAGVLATADAKPTAAEERRFADLDAQLAALRGELRAIRERDLAAFNRALEAAGVPPLMTAPWR
jgi:DNA repair exonuclease SbcCD ATPase subunit